jgi:hypothetical protein
MPEQLKIGDVVMIECHCHSCITFGPPDPSEENGPYIITKVYGDFVEAKAPFGKGKLRQWQTDAVTYKVVGRAES